jgi:hypothetical protein
MNRLRLRELQWQVIMMLKGNHCQRVRIAHAGDIWPLTCQLFEPEDTVRENRERGTVSRIPQVFGGLGVLGPRTGHVIKLLI